MNLVLKRSENGDVQPRERVVRTEPTGVAGLCRGHLRIAAALLAVSQALVCGCGQRGPTLCTVSGTVTLDGVQPTAEVVFEPANGLYAAAAARTKNGQFTLRIPKGECLVRITGWIPGPARSPATSKPPGGEDAEVENVIGIPKHYNLETTLTADVKKSGDRFDFELESAPSKKR